MVYLFFILLSNLGHYLYLFFLESYPNCTVGSCSLSNKGLFFWVINFKEWSLFRGLFDLSLLRLFNILLFWLFENLLWIIGLCLWSGINLLKNSNFNLILTWLFNSLLLNITLNLVFSLLNFTLSLILVLLVLRLVFIAASRLLNCNSDSSLITISWNSSNLISLLSDNIDINRWVGILFDDFIMWIKNSTKDFSELFFALLCFFMWV